MPSHVACGHSVQNAGPNAAAEKRIIKGLSDLLQPVPVQSNLIIDLVCLVGDAVKMLILTVNLAGHSSAQLIEHVGALLQRSPVRR